MDIVKPDQLNDNRRGALELGGKLKKYPCLGGSTNCKRSTWLISKQAEI